jgi:sulfur-oxidizing protein SoxZ
MSTRTLIHKPDRAKPGEVVELRATIAHPMESGFRVDAAGKVVPRKLIRRFTCHEVGKDGETLIFAADFHPAVAANPSVAFHVRAGPATSELTLRWRGDEGFEHRETVTLTVAA